MKACKCLNSTENGLNVRSKNKNGTNTVKWLEATRRIRKLTRNSGNETI